MREFKQEIRKITKGFSRKQNFKLAIYSAELALPIFEKKYPKDNRPKLAVEAAKKCLASNTIENRIYAASYAAATASTAAAYADDAFYAAASAAAFAAPLANTLTAATAADAAFYAAAADSDAVQKIMDYAIKLAEEK